MSTTEATDVSLPRTTCVALAHKILAQSDTWAAVGGTGAATATLQPHEEEFSSRQDGTPQHYSQVATGSDTRW